VRFIGLEVVAVFAYVHRMMLLFRDLKPANLLLDGDGHVRLVDFGVATAGRRKKESPDEPTLSTEECGTPSYMAPEVKSAEQTGPYGNECDLYAIGVLLYELSCKSHPFVSRRAPWNATKFESEYCDPLQRLPKAWREPALADEAAQFGALLAGLVQFDPTQRLGSRSAGGMADLQAHPYWGKPDWELVDRGYMPSPLLHRLDTSDERGEAPDTDYLGELQHAQERHKRVQQLLAEDEEDEGSANGQESSMGRRSVSERLAKDQKLIDRDFENEVEGWDFVAEQAVTQEYLHSAGNVISII